MKTIKRIIQFLNTDLWRIRLKDVHPRKSFWLRQLRILILAIKEFYKDKCLLRASALTFYTLLSIVPILALAFGIAKGFGLERILENQIRKNMQGQEEVVNRVIEFSNNLLDSARGGLVAGIGVVVLLWTIVKVLGNIEHSFNDIWGVKRSRTWGRKLSDYLSFMIIGPIIFIVASSVTVLVTGQVQTLIMKLDLWGWMGGLVYLCLKILPFSLIWGLFTFTYLSLPNTRVRFSSGFIGGIIGGTLFQATQFVYILFQIGASRYGAIYGSLAALPFLLLWLKTSWLIMLFGAEIAFAHQYVDTYEFEPDCLKISPAFKRLITLGIVHLSVEAFKKGDPPPRASEISQKLETPIRLINQILFELVEARIFSEVKVEEEKIVGYQPARDIEEMTVRSVLEQLNDHGTDTIPVIFTPQMEKISGALKEIRELLKDSSANLKIADL